MAINKKRNPFFFDSEAHLVTEQPGLKVLFVGIIFAFVLGFFVRALLNPDRVRHFVQLAGTHIQKDLKVSLESAEISLAYGILPRFSVVVKGVRLESLNECWMSPEVDIDEIEIPFSINRWLRGLSPIRKIYAKNVDMRLFGEFGEGCPNKNGLKVDSSSARSQNSTRKEPSESPTAAATLPNQDLNSGQKPTPPKISLNKNSSPGESEPVSLVRTNNRFDLENSSNLLDYVEIEKFVIEHKKYPQFQPVEFSNIEFVNVNPEKRTYHLDARIHFFHDQLIGDYLSKATLSLDYSDFPEPLAQAHFFGNWREGYFSLMTRYSPSNRDLEFEGELKQIPMSQLLLLMKRWGLTTQDLDTKRVWISARAKGHGVSDQLKKMPFELSGLRIEGDVADIQSDRIEFDSLYPLTLHPFEVDINKFDLDSWVGLFGLPIKPKSVGKWGTFKGHVAVTSADQLKATGQIGEMDFIFANKGRRTVQSIKNTNVDLNFESGKWLLHFSNIEPADGNFSGFFSLGLDFPQQQFDLVAHGVALSLSRSVQSLMTNDGEISPLDIDLNVKIEKGKVIEAKGAFSLENLILEGVRLEGIKSSIDRSKDGLDFNFLVRSALIQKKSSTFPLLLSAIDSNWVGEEGLLFELGSGNIGWFDKNVLTWKVQGNLLHEKKTKYQLEGSWSKDGELSGHILAKSGKQKLEWTLLGSREKPIITPLLKPISKYFLKPIVKEIQKPTPLPHSTESLEKDSTEPNDN